MYGRKLAGFQQGKEVDVVLLSMIGPICKVHAWPHYSTSDQHRQIAPPPKKKGSIFWQVEPTLGEDTVFFFRRSNFCWCFDHRFNTLQYPIPLEETCRKFSMADEEFFGEVQQLNIPVCNYAHPYQEKKTSPWEKSHHHGLAVCPVESPLFVRSSRNTWNVV